MSRDATCLVNPLNWNQWVDQTSGISDMTVM